MSLIQVLKPKKNGIQELVGRSSNQANAMVLLGKMLAESAHYVSEHAGEQVRHTGEVAAAMEQMGASIREIAANAARTSRAASKMAHLNDEGANDMKGLTQSIGEVAQLFERVSDMMRQLRMASDAMGQIVGVISEVAEQTKLLSMNAQIEAAHAGKQGRGFAVVAQEVRGLAEKTKMSTKEIADVIVRNQQLTEDAASAIQEGRNTVEQSVTNAKETASALTEVTSEIETVNTMVQQIASATEQQSATVDSIVSNVDSVAKLARDTLTSANSSHRASVDLAKVASRLEGRVNSFDLEFFGIVPLENAIKMNKSFTPLSGFIGSVLDRRLYVRLGHDYEDAIRDVGAGNALVSYQTPSTYIEAHEKYGVEALVIPLIKGEPFYRSAIVVRDDSGLTELPQLRGKRFAFGDPKSTGSKAMPESMLGEADVALADLADHGFLGSHDNVANAVLQKEYDAGGLMLSVAENYVDKGLKILATSSKIPQFPICASPSLSKAQKQRLIEALVNLRNESILKAMGSGITGFARIKDSDYDGVRAMLKSLGS